MAYSADRTRRNKCLPWAPIWLLAVIAAATLAAPFARAQSPTLKIAVAVSHTGPGAATGLPVLDAVRLAVDEANATGETPRIGLDVYDDRSSDDGARDAARQIAMSDALAVVGPGTTTSALAAGPAYAQAGTAAIVPYAHGAGNAASATTFRPVFSTSEMGEALANYLRLALGGTRAAILFRDNGYGRPLAEGFRRAAERLGIAVTYRAFATIAEAQEFARLAAADPEQPAIVLGMIDPDAVPVITALRRQGVKSQVLGTSATATDAFADNFAKEPESQRDRGFFTDGLYAISPLILDSANAETLAFAARYRARFGKEPRWEAAQGYDAARLAIAAVRAAAQATGASGVQTGRQVALAFLASLDSPAHAMASLTGPLWFTSERGRQQATRAGRFHGAMFESAPVQLVPVPSPSSAEIASGAVVEAGPALFLQRQQVVYTGVFLNEVPRVDIAQSTFTGDFYLWVRFARVVTGIADPTDIDFPDLVRGSFDAKKPAEEGDLDDGTTYRLWRVRGDFKNDFDLHHYPLDRQTLALRFFNARAASDRIIYVQDRRSLPTTVANQATPSGNVAPAAFRNLTQWEAIGSSQRRDILVTESALGNPRLVGVNRVRELSGFNLTIEMRRRVVATLAKTLLPLGLMALIMYASLYFPVGLVKEKVTVAITAALSGAVLLSAINSQLGNVGYVIAVEYVFYLLFTLCLLCIVSVLTAEQLRVAGRKEIATMTERSTRALFLVAIAGTALAAWVVSSRW